MTTATRVEHDSMGALEVPISALWGAQTQRAIQNFPSSGLKMPRAFIRALGLIKSAAAAANSERGDLAEPMAKAIRAAAMEVAEGRHDEHFPVDVFQTGSGTSSNMNANEVIATLAMRTLGSPVHPNDHVNMGQSSNDVVPTAIHVAAALALTEQVLPALRHLGEVLGARAAELKSVVKTGRTHLMDAMPVTLGQELSGWRAQIDKNCARLLSSCRAYCSWHRAERRWARASTRTLSSAPPWRAIWPRTRDWLSWPMIIISRRFPVRIRQWSCRDS